MSANKINTLSRDVAFLSKKIRNLSKDSSNNWYINIQQSSSDQPIKLNCGDTIKFPDSFTINTSNNINRKK